MFLSRVRVNAGSHADKAMPGRQWLRNYYHVHQRLCMAFPSSIRKSDDPDFIEPYKPEDFGKKQIHVERNSSAGFLFRVDYEPRGTTILVQSAIKPDWKYAFHNAGHLLAAFPETAEFQPQFKKGQSMQFRLAANPVRRLSKHSSGKDGKPVETSSIGKRVPVRPEKLRDWLIGKAEGKGFSVNECSLCVQPGYLYFKKPGEKQQGGRLRYARYEGTLQVTDSDRFNETLCKGVGPGKAFGFGLLSVKKPSA